MEKILKKEDLKRSLPFFAFVISSILIININRPFWEDEALYALSTKELFNDFGFFPSLQGSNVQNISISKILLLPHFILINLFGSYEYVFRIVSFIYGICTLFLAKKIIKTIHGKVNLVYFLSLAIFPTFILASTENITVIWLLFFSLLFFYFYLQYYQKKLTFNKFLLYTIIISLLSPFISVIFLFLLILIFIFRLKENRNIEKNLDVLKLFFVTFVIFNLLLILRYYFEFSEQATFSPKTVFSELIYFIIKQPWLKIPYHTIKILEIFISHFSYYLYLPLFLFPLIFFNIRNKKYQLFLLFFLSVIFSLVLAAMYMDTMGTYPARGMVLMSFSYLMLVQPANKKIKKFSIIFYILILSSIVHLIPFLTNHTFYFENNTLYLKDLDEIIYGNKKWIYDFSDERIKIQLKNETECVYIDLEKNHSQVDLGYFDMRHNGDFKIFTDYFWENGKLYLNFDLPFKEKKNHTIFVYFSPNKAKNKDFDYSNCHKIDKYKIQKKQNSFENIINKKVLYYENHPLYHEYFDWRSLTNFLNMSIKENMTLGNNIEFFVSLPSPLIYYLYSYDLPEIQAFYDLHQNIDNIEGIHEHYENFTINVTQELSKNFFGEKWFIMDNMRYWFQLKENEKNFLNEKCEKLFFPKFLIYRCIYVNDWINFEKYFSVKKTVSNSKSNLQNNIENADLIYPYNGVLSSDEFPLKLIREFYIINQTKGWEGSGWIEMNENPIGREGIAIIHPKSKEEPRDIVTPKFILPESGSIVIGFANLAGYFSYASFCDYTDNIFAVYIVKNNESFLIDSVTLTMEEGWKDVAYSISDLSDFQGSEIKIKVEGWAGGKMKWCGEWGTVDYIDVIF